jgi:hypothetical protein
MNLRNIGGYKNMFATNSFPSLLKNYKIYLRQKKQYQITTEKGLNNQKERRG